MANPGRRSTLRRFLLLLTLGPSALAAPPDAIVGNWLTEDGSSRVAIAAAKAADGSTAYAGRIAWLKEPTRDGQPLHDANNRDPALRDRALLGLEVVSGFKADAAGGWSGGTLYSPRTGESYPAEITLAGNGRLAIKVKAGIVSRTLAWTR